MRVRACLRGSQEGHCKPGEVLFGTDSHTCNAGAFGQFATGVGNTDAGFILGTGKLLIKVPPTMRFTFDGQMPEWLLAKDLILQVIGEISVAGEEREQEQEEQRGRSCTGEHSGALWSTLEHSGAAALWCSTLEAWVACAGAGGQL